MNMPTHSNGFAFPARVRETGENVTVFRYADDPAFNHKGRVGKAWQENGCRWWRDDELEPLFLTEPTHSKSTL